MSQPLFPLQNSELLSRRNFIIGTASFAAAAMLSTSRLKGATSAAPKLSAYPFTLGVASGDPTPDSVVIWTRLAPKPLEPGGGMPSAPVVVWWELAEDEGFTKGLRSATTLANPHWAHSVHVEVEGLQPDRWYWYRFRAAGETSRVGRTRTMPPIASSPERLRFAFASCQHYESGLFTAYQHMAKEDLDLIVHLGDYIYEGAARDGHVRKHNSPEIMTIDDYRARYALYKLDPHLQEVHAMAPWIVTWDDHEVMNNYAGDIPGKPATREDFLKRRGAAYQAYFEAMPLRRNTQPKGPDMLLYRRLNFGRLATFNVLDTRQYRTDQPQGDGRKPFNDILLDPAGTIMGAKQRDWLLGNLTRSRTDWNILAQQVMMANVDVTMGPAVEYSMDQWPAYEFERRRVLTHLREAKVKNPVVLTGDIHTNWANELYTDFDGSQGKSVGVEFVGTSIASGGDGEDLPKGRKTTPDENPCVKFLNGDRGYVRCEVTPKQWRTDYQIVPYISRPGAPLKTRASFVVESGTPRLQKA